MSLYEILLWVHVTGAVLWVGGGVTFLMVAERALASGDVPRIQNALDDAERLGKRFFMPLSILTLAAGIWLVLEGGWGFTQPFVIGGIAGLVASAVLGGAVLTPVSEKLATGLRAAGSVTPEVHASIIKLRNLARLDSAILLVVVFLMTTKPGT